MTSPQQPAIHEQQRDHAKQDQRENKTGDHRISNTIWSRA